LFLAELARVRGSGALAESGRLRELFDYLADRGPGRPARRPRADIADSVFGQPDTEGDDATARVYVHRLRKRLDEYYASEGDGPGGARLVLPAGTYALRLAGGPIAAPVATLAPADGRKWWAVGLAMAAALVATFLLGRALPGADAPPPANAFWQPFLESDRPIVVVVGDYYMFGEIDPVSPEMSRLIRDFRVDSPMDLAAMQEADPTATAMPRTSG
jgi:hypothetical protein